MWTIPEFVPLAARPGSGSASSSVTDGAAPGQSSATAAPTTPAPTTAISASTRATLTDAGPERRKRARQRLDSVAVAP